MSCVNAEGLIFSASPVEPRTSANSIEISISTPPMWVCWSNRHIVQKFGFLLNCRLPSSRISTPPIPVNGALHTLQRGLAGIRPTRCRAHIWVGASPCKKACHCASLRDKVLCFCSDIVPPETYSPEYYTLVWERPRIVTYFLRLPSAIRHLLSAIRQLPHIVQHRPVMVVLVLNQSRPGAEPVHGVIGRRPERHPVAAGERARRDGHVLDRLDAPHVLPIPPRQHVRVAPHLIDCHRPREPLRAFRPCPVLVDGLLRLFFRPNHIQAIIHPHVIFLFRLIADRMALDLDAEDGGIPVDRRLGHALHDAALPVRDPGAVRIIQHDVVRPCRALRQREYILLTLLGGRHAGRRQRRTGCRRRWRDASRCRREAAPRYRRHNQQHGPSMLVYHGDLHSTLRPFRYRRAFALLLPSGHSPTAISHQPSAISSSPIPENASPAPRSLCTHRSSSRPARAAPRR